MIFESKKLADKNKLSLAPGLMIILMTIVFLGGNPIIPAYSQTSDIPKLPTFQDEFEDNTSGWTSVSEFEEIFVKLVTGPNCEECGIGNIVIDVENLDTLYEEGIYTELEQPLSNTQWVVRIPFFFIEGSPFGEESTTSPQEVFFSISSTNAMIPFDAEGPGGNRPSEDGLQDHISFQYVHNGLPAFEQGPEGSVLFSNYGDGQIQESGNHVKLKDNLGLEGFPGCMEIIRNSETSVTWTLYEDKACISSLVSDTRTIPATITDLQFIKFNAEHKPCIEEGCSRDVNVRTSFALDSISIWDTTTSTTSTPVEAVDDLTDVIQDLIDNETLSEGQGDSLISKLDNIIEKIGNGQTNASCNQLGAFINQITAFINNGIISEEDALAQIDATQAIKDASGC